MSCKNRDSFVSSQICMTFISFNYFVMLAKKCFLNRSDGTRFSSLCLMLGKKYSDFHSRCRGSSVSFLDTLSIPSWLRVFFFNRNGFFWLLSFILHSYAINSQYAAILLALDSHKSN